MDINLPKAITEGTTIAIDRQQFASSLVAFRLSHDYTQAALAARWGCSRYTIMRAEAAKPISWQQAYRLYAHLSDEFRA